jgi:predicted phage terminase large subunit-like protein
MAGDDPLIDQFHVLFLPAIALDESNYPQTIEDQKKQMLNGVWLPIGGDMLGRKPGEPLWPYLADEKELLKKKSNVGDDEWWPVYQQMPRALSGGFFIDSDFIRVDEAPKGLKWFRYIDLALGRNSKSDWNSCVAVAHDETSGLIYFRDMIRVRALEEFLKVIKGWMLDAGEKGTTWAVEDVAFQTVVFTDFMKDKELLNVVIGQEKPEGDKLTRARSWQIRARQGFLRVVNGPWVQAFIDECKNFSANARHDDQVDTASGGYKMCGEKKFKAGEAVA